MIILNIMTNEKLTHLLKIAYRWGRDNGSNRSEKNFNDLLQTEAISQALRIHDVVGQSEQLVCEYCNEDAKPTCCDSCLKSMVNAVQKAN